MLFAAAGIKFLTSAYEKAPPLGDDASANFPDLSDQALIGAI